jgi:threonine aldolase
MSEEKEITPFPRRGFGSDNHSGAHPKILEAVVRANLGHAPSYGTDEYSEQALQVLRGHFGAGTEAHFVFNGTAANVLALSACVKSHHSVLASVHSHLLNDECGAPEKSLGCKVIPVPSTDAKLTVESLKPFVIRRGDQHFSQVRAISITQPTELGTIYTLDEIRAISAFAKKERLLLHMDGARLVNAAAALNCTLKEMTTDCGVDMVSLGGTKNGLLFGEAVVFLNKALANDDTGRDFKFVRKQLMQLPSKTRFIAAQFVEFLGTELWLKNAKHANDMAQRLSRGLQDSPYANVTQKTQANGVFVILPKALVSKLKQEAFFYVWDEATFECRLMTSWDTEPSDIDRFLAKLKELGDAL